MAQAKGLSTDALCEHLDDTENRIMDMPVADPGDLKIKIAIYDQYADPQIYGEQIIEDLREYFEQHSTAAA